MDGNGNEESEMACRTMGPFVRYLTRAVTVPYRPAPVDALRAPRLTTGGRLAILRGPSADSSHLRTRYPEESR